MIKKHQFFKKVKLYLGYTPKGVVGIPLSILEKPLNP